MRHRDLRRRRWQIDSTEGEPVRRKPGASATHFVFAVSETSLEPVPLLGRLWPARPAGRFGLSRAHEPIQRVVDGVAPLRVPPRPARGGVRRRRGVVTSTEGGPAAPGDAHPSNVDYDELESRGPSLARGATSGSSGLPSSSASPASPPVSLLPRRGPPDTVTTRYRRSAAR